MVAPSEIRLPTISVFRPRPTRSRKVSQEPTVSNSVPRASTSATTAKRSRHQIELVNTDQPQTAQATRKRNRLQPTSPVREKPTKSVTAAQSQTILKRTPATAARRPLPAKPKSIDNAPSISKGPEITKVSSDEIPNSLDLVSLGVTDPEELVRRKELLDIPEGHKLIHVLRHATSWSK